jgi:hypothetical protein
MAGKANKVLYIRHVPHDLANKLKAAAALSGESLTEYLHKTLHAHITDLERTGRLPKSK